MDEHKISAEELDQHFKALGDSVDLIHRLKDNGPREGQSAEEAADEVSRNVEHIKIMLEKNFIKDSGRDLTPYTDAVTKGS